MLDLRWMLAHREEVESCLKNRGHDFDMDVLTALDEERRRKCRVDPTAHAQKDPVPHGSPA